MDTFIEVSPTSKHGMPPVLYHREDIEGLTGFRSVYEYPVEACHYITDNASIAGLAASHIPVYTDRLLMDIDDDEESAAKFIASLKSWNITHSSWTSGNRSVHIHILVEPQLSFMLPSSQKKFVEEWGRGIGAKADLSIYHAAGLFRLPGTIHASTGRPKELLETYWGNTLHIPLLSEGPKRIYKEGEEALLSSVWRLLLTPLDVGGRRFHVFKITSNAVKLGWDENKILEHLRWWNESMPIGVRLSAVELEDKMWKSL
jgi:hypothetical protein